MKRKHFAVLLVLAASSLFAQSPFDGKWTLNPQKSNMTGETMKIEDAGSGAIKFVNPAFSYTVKTDGTKAETPGGGMRAMQKKGADTYHSTDWMKGMETGQADWTLSNSGKTLTVRRYGTNPNGEKFNDTTTYTRAVAGNGLAGDWKVTSTKIGNPEWFTMKLAGSDLTWEIPAMKATLKVPTDGKEARPTGPTIPEDLTLAVSKKGTHSLDVTEKLKGKTLFTGTYTVAADGKTMTVEGKNSRGEPTKQVWEKQ